ncbi:MAG: hypothetical protein L0229_17490 [Blastocatellia bacterium]|nr:hypothetical protein [Blastocatellia bacterium]
MSLFHKLQDVYFDAVKLREELSQIPGQCDCGDADAHLSGRCCCANVRVDQNQIDSHSRVGCPDHLEQLSRSTRWFQEDSRRGRKELGPETYSEELEGRLFLIQSLMDGFGRAVNSIEADLKEFRATCAHGALARMKKSSAELDKYITDLNEIL